ncbi:MAG TPA: hypothetical protein PLI51_04670 [bacterium]|nr:hypothetical protein [bacterium]HPQ66004.1 hypothetical protein [bacterium]
MRGIGCLSSVLLAAALSVRAGEEPVPAGGEEVEIACPNPAGGEPVLLRATVPAGWKRNPGFGTAVFEPADADDFSDPPRIEIQVLCEGECGPETVSANIDGYIERLETGWKKLSTGRAALDRQEGTVEVVADERAPGGRLLEVKLTYPDGVSRAMYPPRYWIYRFRHDTGDPYFIVAVGKVPIDAAGRFLAEVRASCLSVGARQGR